MLQLRTAAFDRTAVEDQLPLLWFHAFDRPNAEAVLEVLRTSADVPPFETRTKANERLLGITPHRVYAYLGKTLEAFGKSAFALPVEAIEGHVSPFDTGGLVDHIEPVRGWQDSRKQQFLNQFSWDSDELPERLGTYPGTRADAIAAYLKTERPSSNGPGDVWLPFDHELCEGDIWRAGDDDGRAWLWEIRSPSVLATGGQLVGWSCSTEVWNDIQEYIESLDDDADTAWLESLMSLYHDGGVGALIRALRARQEEV